MWIYVSASISENEALILYLKKWILESSLKVIDIQ